MADDNWHAWTVEGGGWKRPTTNITKTSLNFWTSTSPKVKDRTGLYVLLSSKYLSFVCRLFIAYPLDSYFPIPLSMEEGFGIWTIRRPGSWYNKTALPLLCSPVVDRLLQRTQSWLVYNRASIQISPRHPHPSNQSLSKRLHVPSLVLSSTAIVTILTPIYICFLQQIRLYPSDSP